MRINELTESHVFIGFVFLSYIFLVKLLVFVLIDNIRDLVHFRQLGPWVIIEKIWLPLPLYWFFSMKNSWTTSFKCFSPQLISQCIQSSVCLLLFIISKRKVFVISVDIRSSDKRMMIPLANKIEFNLWIRLNKLL